MRVLFEWVRGSDRVDFGTPALVGMLLGSPWSRASDQRERAVVMIAVSLLCSGEWEGKNVVKCR